MSKGLKLLLAAVCSAVLAAAQNSSRATQPSLYDRHETALYLREYHVRPADSFSLDTLSREVLQTRAAYPAKALVVVRFSTHEDPLLSIGAGAPVITFTMAVKTVQGVAAAWRGRFAEGICLGSDCVLRASLSPGVVSRRVLSGTDLLRVEVGLRTYEIDWLSFYLLGVYRPEQRPADTPEWLEVLVRTPELVPAALPLVHATLARRFPGLQLSVWFSTAALATGAAALLYWHPLQSSASLDQLERLTRPLQGHSTNETGIPCCRVLRAE